MSITFLQARLKLASQSSEYCFQVSVMIAKGVRLCGCSRLLHHDHLGGVYSLPPLSRKTLRIPLMAWLFKRLILGAVPVEDFSALPGLLRGEVCRALDVLQERAMD